MAQRTGRHGVDVDDRAASSRHGNQQRCLQFQLERFMRGPALQCRNSSNCSVQVAILDVLLRLWRPWRLQPGVHCMLSVRRSITRFLLRPTCRVHFDALWEVRDMEARSQEKLMSVSNTMDSRDEVSHTVLIFDCPDTLTSRSTWPAQGVWDTKVDNIKPQWIALSSRWLQCDHQLRPTRTRSTSCRRSSTKKSRDCTFLTRYRAHRPFSGTGSL